MGLARRRREKNWVFGPLNSDLQGGNGPPQAKKITCKTLYYSVKMIKIAPKARKFWIQIWSKSYPSTWPPPCFRADLGQRGGGQVVGIVLINVNNWQSWWFAIGYSCIHYFSGLEVLFKSFSEALIRIYMENSKVSSGFKQGLMLGFLIFFILLLIINLIFKNVLGDNLNQTLITGISFFGICSLFQRLRWFP